jgi:hypothetical protein
MKMAAAIMAAPAAIPDYVRAWRSLVRGLVDSGDSWGRDVDSFVDSGVSLIGP